MQHGWKSVSPKFCCLCVQKLMFRLMQKLEEAQKAVEEGIALEPVLRKNIEELEEEKKELMVHVFCMPTLHGYPLILYPCSWLRILQKELANNIGESSNLEMELAVTREALKTLEEERDQKMETIRVREVSANMSGKTYNCVCVRVYMSLFVRVCVCVYGGTSKQLREELEKI